VLHGAERQERVKRRSSGRASRRGAVSREHAGRPAPLPPRADRGGPPTQLPPLSARALSQQATVPRLLVLRVAREQFAEVFGCPLTDLSKLASRSWRKAMGLRPAAEVWRAARRSSPGWSAGELSDGELGEAVIGRRGARRRCTAAWPRSCAGPGRRAPRGRRRVFQRAVGSGSPRSPGTARRVSTQATRKPCRARRRPLVRRAACPQTHVLAAGQGPENRPHRVPLPPRSRGWRYRHPAPIAPYEAARAGVAKDASGEGASCSCTCRSRLSLAERDARGCTRRRRAGYRLVHRALRPLREPDDDDLAIERRVGPGPTRCGGARHLTARLGCL